MDKILKQWIYECLGVLMKEPTEENRKIVAETIFSEVEDKYTNELKILKEENNEYENEAREVNFRMHNYIVKTVPKLINARKIISEFCDFYIYECDETHNDVIAFNELKEKGEKFIKTLFENGEN